MSMESSKLNRKDVSRPVAEMAAKLLPIVARKKAARSFPTQAGWSYFYEVSAGWETDALRLDDDITLAATVQELEDAFGDIAVKTVFIPASASITKEIALKICRRHGHGKTLFYEVHDE